MTLRLTACGWGRVKGWALRKFVKMTRLAPLWICKIIKGVWINSRLLLLLLLYLFNVPYSLYIKHATSGECASKKSKVRAMSAEQLPSHPFLQGLSTQHPQTWKCTHALDNNGWVLSWDATYELHPEQNCSNLRRKTLVAHHLVWLALYYQRYLQWINWIHSEWIQTKTEETNEIRYKMDNDGNWLSNKRFRVRDLRWKLYEA